MARGKTKEETKTKAAKKTKPKTKPPAKTKAKTSKKKEEAKEVEELERVEPVEEGRPEPVKAGLEVPSPAEEAKEVVREEVEELKEEAEVEEVKEEAKPEKAAEEEELEIVEEKFYDLNLRRIWTAPREKRTPRAVRFLRAFVARRMKTDDVAISEAANSMLWARGISKPPRKIRVRVVKDKEGRVIVFPGEGK